jgi:putative ABC transport system permease protein
MRQFIRRLINTLRPKVAEDETAREIDAHLALLEDEHRRRGLSPDDARRAARHAMGSVALVHDLHRDARSFVRIEDVARDFRHAVRTLRRAPGFTLIAVFALGLGIGVNTTFFTIVNAICLRGLPIDSPDRVMYVSGRDAQDRSANLSYLEFDELRSRTTAFEQVAAYTITVAVVADSRQPPERVSAAYVSAGGFELLGDEPVIGRGFRPEEDRPGSPPVVILGGDLWSSRYASDPGIVGQSVTVNGVVSTVIGVMPRGFMFPGNADLWRPMANLPANVRESRSERRLAVYARLNPTATLEQARADTSAMGDTWARDFPATNRGLRMRVVPINEQLNPTVAQRGWIAFITAGVLVLLIACANVANLMLMRAATRGREIAIRTSMGATRARVVRQMLVESSTLAAFAGLFGVFVAWIGLQALSAIIPPETLPYWMAFTIDVRVLAVLIAVCVASVFVCGLPSALHVTRVDPRDTLTESGTTATVARPTRRWIAALLAAEFAVTFVLVALAVMSARSTANTLRTEFQIDPASLQTLWVTLPVESYKGTEARTAFFDRLSERIDSSSAITSHALTSVLPHSGGPQQPVAVSGQSPVDDLPTAAVVAASESYFHVLGIPLVRGRAFTSVDGMPGREAAIVNQRFVRMFLADQQPIGTRIRLGKGETPWIEIVGVATTVRQQQVAGSEPDPVVFLPFRTASSATSIIVVRTRQDPATAISLLRSEVARIDPNLPLYRAMSFEQATRNALWNGRLSDTLVRSIAVVALVLAVIGLYAVTGHTVERWTRELGLRIALGAKSSQIGWLVLRRVLTQLSVGLVVGIAGAVAFDRVFNQSATQGERAVSMIDPSALMLIILSIVIVAIVACLVPIRRATTLDPVETLRS